MAKRIFLLAFVLAPLAFLGQKSVKDSIIYMSMISVHGGFDVPGGNLADRFGNNAAIGVGYAFKSKKNYLLSAEFDFLFGNTVTEPGLLSNLLSESNEILDDEGQVAEVLVQERGAILGLSGGKVFNFLGPNPNSGLVVKGGVAFLRHKIRLEHQLNDITQLEGEYLKGYDRLTNGFALQEFVGYQHMSNSGIVNFYIGLELTQGFTKSRRAVNFDTQMASDPNRVDILAGIRAGWIFALYRRPADEFYFD